MIQNFKNKFLLKYFLVIVLVFMSFDISAQVFFNSTHISTLHQQFDQPALSGQSEGIRAFAAYRYQWVGIEGAPSTIFAGVDMKLPLKNSSGGFFIAHDRVGATAFTSAHMTYAYSIPIKKNTLSVGAKLGIVNMQLDGSKLITPSDNIGIEDPLLNSSKSSSIRPELGMGIAFNHPVFHVQMYVNNLADFKSKIDGIDDKFETYYGRYAGLGAGAKIAINEKISLDPTILLRSDFINYQFDISLSTTFLKKYSLGLGSRGYNKKSFESLFFITKIIFPKDIGLMYSYDWSLNSLQTVSNGSHEISIQYIIPKKYLTNRTKIINHPRYL
jgi:type IX secretion system PorP/SprF family membrane protein